MIASIRRGLNEGLSMQRLIEGKISASIIGAAKITLCARPSRTYHIKLKLKRRHYLFNVGDLFLGGTVYLILKLGTALGLINFPF